MRAIEERKVGYPAIPNIQAEFFNIREHPYLLFIRLISLLIFEFTESTRTQAWHHLLSFFFCRCTFFEELTRIRVYRSFVHSYIISLLIMHSISVLSIIQFQQPF